MAHHGASRWQGAQRRRAAARGASWGRSSVGSFSLSVDLGRECSAALGVAAERGCRRRAWGRGRMSQVCRRVGRNLACARTQVDGCDAGCAARRLSPHRTSLRAAVTGALVHPEPIVLVVRRFACAPLLSPVAACARSPLWRPRACRAAAVGTASTDGRSQLHARSRSSSASGC